jgi:hypothetical protein
MALNAEWRTRPGFDSVLLVDAEKQTVQDSIPADPDILSDFLTDMEQVYSHKGRLNVADDKKDPAAWGELVMTRGEQGEIIEMDPERFWDGIYLWFRSRGVDYNTHLTRR